MWKHENLSLSAWFGRPRKIFCRLTCQGNSTVLLPHIRRLCSFLRNSDPPLGCWENWSQRKTHRHFPHLHHVNRCLFTPKTEARVFWRPTWRLLSNQSRALWYFSSNERNVDFVYRSQTYELSDNGQNWNRSVIYLRKFSDDTIFGDIWRQHGSACWITVYW